MNHEISIEVFPRENYKEVRRFPVLDSESLFGQLRLPLEASSLGRQKSTGIKNQNPLTSNFKYLWLVLLKKNGFTAKSPRASKAFIGEGKKLVEEPKLLEAARAFRRAAGRAFKLGLQAGSGGNISLRINSDLFLTKPTGIGLRECRESDLVLMNGQGQVLEGTAKPTKEVMTHLSIYGVRPDVNGIVHYHAPYCTAYAVGHKPLPLPTLHARRILMDVPLIAEYPEGSPELARAVSEAARNREVTGILLASHGLMAFGPTLTQAQYLAELMEESARVGWLTGLIV
jgi:L-ribulose-5-phosphate 4-epimerase